MQKLSLRYFIASFVSLVLTFLLVDFSRQPPAAVSQNAPAELFSAERAWQQLQDLLKEGVGHPIGSDANKLVKQRLLTKLTNLGLQPQVQKTFACSSVFLACGNVENILAELPGKNPDKAIMVMAHYDSVPVSPGAADDGAGVAVMLEVARIMMQAEQAQNSVIFHFTDGEEAGLLGIEGFAAEHPWAKRVDTVLVLEAGGTSGSSNLLRTAVNNQREVNLLVEHLSHPTVNSTGNEGFKYVAADTDLAVTLRAGMGGMDFAFGGDRVHYHTLNDSMQYLDVRSLQSHGDNLLPLVQALSNLELNQQHDSEHVFTDVAASFVLAWSKPTGQILGGILIALIVLTFWGWRAHLNLASYFIGLFLCMTLVITSTVLGQVVVAQLSRHLPGVNFPANAWPWLATLVILGMLVTTVAVASFYKRLQLASVLLAAWSVWWAIALLFIVVAPGAATTFLLPGLASAGLLAIAPYFFKSLNNTWLITAMSSGAGLFMFVLCQSVYSGLGLGSSVILATSFSLLLIICMPLLLSAAQHQVWRLSWLLGLALFISAGLTQVLPVFTPSYAQVVNIKHVTDLNRQQSQWQFVHNGELPLSLRQLPEVKSSQQRWYPWPGNKSDDYQFLASAPLLTEPGPELTVLQRGKNSAGNRTAVAQLASARGARVAQLFIPKDAGLERLKVNGIAIEFAQARSVVQRFGNYHSVMLHGLDDKGVSLSFDYSEQTLPLIIMDISEGLPSGGEYYSNRRPAHTTQLKEGDSTIMMRHLTL